MASALVIAMMIGAGIQFVPYARDRSNPPVTEEPDWNSARTRELFFGACRDCHSNETEWPWYARVAPASWLVRWDVEEGRSHFNVSEWAREHNAGEDAAEMVREGAMPLQRYLLLHPEARLSEGERRELVAGLAATFPESGNTSSSKEHEGQGRQGDAHAH